MKKLEELLTEKFYQASKLKDVSEVHRHYVRFRKYVLENEHNQNNFTEITRTYIEYINSTNMRLTLNLEEEE